MNNIVQEPEQVDDSDLIDITDKVVLKAFLRHDDIMGKHIVLYVNRGNDDNAVGVDIHPTISKKLLNQFDDEGNCV